MADLLKYVATIWTQLLDYIFNQYSSIFWKQTLIFITYLGKKTDLNISKIPENVNKNNGNQSINHKTFNLINSLQKKQK